MTTEEQLWSVIEENADIRWSDMPPEVAEELRRRMRTKKHRELDVQIHREVMGGECVRLYGRSEECFWTGWFVKWEGGLPDRPTPVPPYSTDIAAAWEVVKALLAVGLDITINCDSLTRFLITNVKISYRNDPDKGEELPEAICHAALATINPEKALALAGYTS